MKYLLCFFTFACMGGTPVPVLLWNANTETNLAGYTVYIGKASRTYTESIQTTNTSYQLTCRPSGTYFFAVTARNTDGLESAYSEELEWTSATNSPCPPSAPDRPRVIFSLETATDPEGPWRLYASNQVVVAVQPEHQFFRTKLEILR